MRDIYDAIELYSIVLFGRLRRMAHDYGWAIKGYGWDQARGDRRFVKVHGSILHLPGGGAASFTPRSEPSSDEHGETWVIDIRRVDGVTHPSWMDGIAVRKKGSTWELWYRAGGLSDIDLAIILDDLATIAPRGPATSHSGQVFT